MGKVITIDGPAGSGKSTTARAVARRLGGTLLDTGAIYRCIALAARRRGVSTDDVEGLAKVALEAKVSFQPQDDPAKGDRVFLDGDDVSHEIRTSGVSLDASKISAHPEVREALLQVQRDLAREGIVVAEGRDMGTVVFPQARHKFFLDANTETRAKRRYKELLEKGEQISYHQVLADQKSRDRRDAEREASPLRAAEDAVRIDSTQLTPKEVVETILARVNQKKESQPL